LVFIHVFACYRLAFLLRKRYML